MSQKMLQLSFKLNVPPNEYEQIAASVAQAFADVPGLIWKVWLLNADEIQAGGLYLFRDEEARQSFLQSSLAETVRTASFLRDLEVKLFDPMYDVTAITRGPLGVAVEA